MWIRVLFAFILPPLAVIKQPIQWDRVLVTTLATIFGTPIMGTIVALFILFAPQQYEYLKRELTGIFGNNERHYTPRKTYEAPDDNRTFIQLEDGERLEVVDTELEERRNRLQH